MPRMILTGSIRQHAGGHAAVAVGGETVRAAIAALEEAHPALRGWVVDERGALRRHVKLFHRGASVSLDAAVGPEEEVHVVAAISGG
ncbi:MAG: MoaD/ThiS family protein [Hyphomicrobiaceae bacterium]|nr:MoaD/ThiS family protein [Hyphomicrobiaceae bacterium]